MIGRLNVKNKFTQSKNKQNTGGTGWRMARFSVSFCLKIPTTAGRSASGEEMCWDSTVYNTVQRCVQQQLGFAAWSPPPYATQLWFHNNHLQLAGQMEAMKKEININLSMAISTQL